MLTLNQSKIKHLQHCGNGDQHEKYLLGSFHQGDKQFGRSAGKQCTCIALVAAARAAFNLPDQWNSNDLDGILHEGNVFYNHLGISGIPSLERLPGYIFCSRASYPWVLPDQALYTGGLCISYQHDDPYCNLFTALHRAFDKEMPKATSLLICHGYTIAIIKIDYAKYAVVDSHARNGSGQQDPSGKAVVLFFSSLKKLHTGLLRLFLSAGADLCDVSYNLYKVAVIQKVSNIL